MGGPGGAGAKGREAGETGKSRQRVVAWAGRGTRQGADPRDPGGWSWHPERRARGQGGRHASGGARPGAGAAWAMRPQVWGPGAASAPERRRGRSGAPGAHGRVWVLRRGGVGEPWPQARPEVSAPMSRKPGPWQADGPSLVLRFPVRVPRGDSGAAPGPPWRWSSVHVAPRWPSRRSTDRACGRRRRRSRARKTEQDHVHPGPALRSAALSLGPRKVGSFLSPGEGGGRV